MPHWDSARGVMSVPTSFANPAVSVTRTMSETFAGIDPASAPAFVVLQLIGMALAVGVARVLHP
jgi:glycerol uptake facilitator-like aquaporin